jgi:hypothetical protein
MNDSCRDIFGMVKYNKIKGYMQKNVRVRISYFGLAPGNHKILVILMRFI